MNHKFVAAAAVLALTAAACSGSDSASETTLPPTTTAAPTTTDATTTTSEVVATEPATTEAAPAVLRQPLTGVVVESADELITRPALVVKIDNNDAGARRNHSGLGVADIVYEEIVEGDTRFAAVFQSQDSDPVGPIRSGREQDVAMLSAYNAPLFAWSGGNPGVTRLIADSLLTDLNPSTGGRGAYYRGPGAKPHNYYSSTEALYALTPPDQPGPPPQQFTYVEPGASFTGEPVVDVDLRLRYKDVRWEWDAGAAGFARYQSGSRHVDAVTGDIFATNVIVMVAEYGSSSIDNRSPEAMTLGSGPVYVFSNGQVVTGRWERDSVIAPLHLVDDDGEPIALTPGNTWIEVADNTGDPAFIGPVPPTAGDDTDSTSSVAPSTTTGFPVVDPLDPENAPTDITIRFPEAGPENSTANSTAAGT